ncbi:MAG: hypothetical protein IT492_08265 [Gammaproteobacteria bacterium]|nr:hypothetical protein [Gammaproteobacteria bacterium]
MNLRNLMLIAALGAVSLSSSMTSAEPLTRLAKSHDTTHVLPGERYMVGADRDVALLKGAATDTITTPVTIAHQVRDEYQNYGPLGVISGAIRGGIKGGVQLLGGAVKGSVGILDVATAPIGGIEN